MIAVRVGKTNWHYAMSDWLVTQLEIGKYGFNRKTLEPDFPYFEYIFIHAEDATAFSLTFNIITNEDWIYW